MLSVLLLAQELVYDNSAHNNNVGTEVKGPKPERLHWSQAKPLSDNVVSNADVPVNLADGHYDEAAQRAAFQQAVMEWRGSGKVSDDDFPRVCATLVLTCFVPHDFSGTRPCAMFSFRPFRTTPRPTPPACRRTACGRIRLPVPPLPPHHLLVSVVQPPALGLDLDLGLVVSWLVKAALRQQCQSRLQKAVGSC